MKKTRATKRPVYYSDYLRLGDILSSQRLKSKELGRPAHDEMLFIVVHQAYELWFKQILHELDSVLTLFRRESVDETSIGVAVSRLTRVTMIQRLLIDQLAILETMTPLDFLEFRDFLTPSSGFQSVQFRLIENKLGLAPDERLEYNACPYHAHVTPEHRKTMIAAEGEPSLLRLVERWIERTPFLDLEGYRFWEAYRGAVDRMLARDRDTIRGNPILSPAQRAGQIRKLSETRAHFDSLFDPKRYRQLLREGRRRFSQRALLAAVFIHLYRDQPILHLPFKLLTALVDIDELLTSWRYRHALMARRMIGMKIGTGGSSGYQYLASTVDKHKIFSDLVDLPTFLIPRSELPKLPPEIEVKLGFHYTAAGA